jgi:hypothetical protein
MRCRPDGRRYRPATFGVMITRKTAHIEGLKMAPAGLFWADEVHTDRLPHRGAIVPDRAPVERSSSS